MRSTRDHPGTPTRTVLANGVGVHYIDQGSGPAVILLHGGMGDAESWTHLLRTLSVQHRVVPYSRRHSSPNHNADANGSHCIDHDIEDLLALQSALHTGPAHLIGTSYGALIALAFALKHRDRVLSLVLDEPPLHRWACASESGARLYSDFIEQVWHPAAEAFGLGLERRAMQMLTDGIRGRTVFETWPEDRVKGAMRNSGAMKALTQAHDPFPDLDRAAVAQMATPALLVQGEHASALHRQVMNELAGAMTSAKRVEIAGAGHGSPSENPESFDAAVLAFLDSVQARAGAPK